MLMLPNINRVMSSPPEKSATSAAAATVQSTKVGMADKEVEIVRYHPSQLKIEKRPGKKTAQAFFCGAVRRSAAAPRSRADGESSSEAAAAPSPPPVSEASNASSVNEDSDFSDNLSVVSDLSDLSVISLSHSCLSDASGVARHNSLAAVHGGPVVRHVGHPRRSRDAIQFCLDY